MTWHSPGFVLALIAMSMVAFMITTAIRAKHGYPLQDDWSGWGGTSGKENLDADRKVHLLTSENEKLTGQVSRLEERIAVLERIATDPATRTYAEIEALRDRPVR